MKISKHDQKLILVLLGLIIFFAAYFGICKPFNSKKADVKTQITELETQAAELQAYVNDEASYTSEIEKINNSISEELAKYPSDVRSEDLVIYVKSLEEATGITVQSLSIANPELVSQFNIPKKSGDTYEIVPIAALKTALTIKCSLTYAQYKKLITEIYSSSNKTGLSSAALSYDQESGALSGVVTIDKYFIASNDYTYSPTDIPDTQKGVTDPFGSGSVSTDTTGTTGGTDNAGATNGTN